MTIKDIAKLAGVSIATVSRVINHQPVEKSTAERVSKIIQLYEYYPNTYAQYLGRRSRIKNRKKNGTVSSIFKKSA